MIETSNRFPRCTQSDPKVPVWFVTPGAGPASHRFLAPSPISPAGRDRTLVRVRTQPDHEGPKRRLRVDSRPVWAYDSRRVAFNACPDGGRGVYVADLSDMLQ